jgi:hypothetical protein
VAKSIMESLPTVAQAGPIEQTEQGKHPGCRTAGFGTPKQPKPRQAKSGHTLS